MKILTAINLFCTGIVVLGVYLNCKINQCISRGLALERKYLRDLQREDAPMPPEKSRHCH